MSPRLALIATLLLTAAAYFPVHQNSFVSLDDDVYIPNNRHVRTGLTLPNIVWAFSPHFLTGNYHPITWLSLQLDATIWGTNPLGYHLTNLLIHLANVSLLYFLIARWSPWRAGIIAAIWALHPLRVESVAWASERKDVLSVFFGLLAIRAYCGFRIADFGFKTDFNSAIRNPKSAMLRTSLWMILSLLCKPMFVTLPILLLLLDHWPLNSPHSAFRTPHSAFLSKWPLWLITAFFCVLTMISQSSFGTMSDLDLLPLHSRITNAIYAAASYLWLHLRIHKLAVFYPFIATRHWSVIALSAAVLIAISFWIFTTRSRRPYLLVGWCWYLVTLAPVIGLVQVGAQSMADRYTYLPSVGLLIMLAWLIPDQTWQATPSRRAILGATAILAMALAYFTSRQVATWKDNLTLFTHAIDVTEPAEPNCVAHNSLGTALADLGMIDAAIAEYRTSLHYGPNQYNAMNNLGSRLIERGEMEEGLKHLMRSIELNPKGAEAHYNLGNAYRTLGKLDLAEIEWRKALQIKEDMALARNNLALTIANQGRHAEAFEQYRLNIQYNPQHAATYVNLGSLYEMLKQYDQAIEQYHLALNYDPKLLEGHLNLALVHARKGEWEQAEAYFQRGRQLYPTHERVKIALDILNKIKAAQGRQ